MNEHLYFIGLRFICSHKSSEKQNGPFIPTNQTEDFAKHVLPFEKYIPNLLNVLLSFYCGSSNKFSVLFLLQLLVTTASPLSLNDKFYSDLFGYSFHI